MYFSRMVWGALGVLAFASVTGGAFAGNEVRTAFQDGLSHIESASFEAAVADFTIALSSGNLSADEKVLALFNRGVSWDCVGDADNAIADYTAVLELNPFYAPALNNRGNAYRLSGRSAEAKRDYNAVLNLSAGAKLASARAYAYFGLSALATMEGDAAAAQDYLNQARLISAKDPEATNPSNVDVTRDSGAGGDAAADGNKTTLSRLHGPVRHAIMPLSRRAVTQAGCIKNVGPSLRLRLPVAPSGCQANQAAGNEAGRRGARSVWRRDLVPPHVSGEAAGGYAVQLGSYRQASAAEVAWEHFSEIAGGALDGLSPQIVEAEIPQRGRFYRLRARVDGYEPAGRLCQSLNATGVDCLVVRLPG